MGAPSGGAGVSPLSGGAPGVLPPPVFKDAASTPLSTLGGAAPPPSAGPSEFTQMISRAPAPVVPEVQAVKAPDPKVAAKEKRRLPLGLIVVINAVILIAVLLVVFVLKRPVPTAPKAPTAPAVTAPQIPK